jgi:UDPglucose--hexose-1-phosphate uridylyltransferase
VTPWRAPGVPRFVAAGELGSGVYFNPVAPEAAAQSLREARA